MKKECFVEDCNNKIHGFSIYCKRHYTRNKRHGNPYDGRPTNKDILAWAYSLFFVDQKIIECIKWPFTTSASGYGNVTHDGKKKIASRFICELRHGEPKNKFMEASHSCGNGHLGCVNPNHLSWKTKKENMQDMVTHGTRAYGERVNGAKLTWELVRNIRCESKTSKPIDLSVKYNLTRGQISAILNYKRWVNDPLMKASNE